VCVFLVYANLKDDILAAPPIGLSYVACATQAAGHTVNFLDLCFQKKWMSVLKSRIEEFRPEVIGISIRNIDKVNLLHPKSYLPEVKRIIETIRNTTPIPLVIGGSGASMCPAEVLSELKADFIIVSASADMIRNYKKGFTVDDLVCAAEALSKTRFTALWFFLIGGPGENNSTLDQSLKFILKYLNQPKPPPYSMANLFLGVRLYPGTELWKIASEGGVIHLKSNPLKQLWYVSKHLDLKLAFNQMTGAAKRCPGIILGFDEKHFSFSSKLATWMGKIVRMPKPYWRHGLGYNRILLWTGLRFFSAMKSLLFEIQGKLDRQISG